MLQNKYVRFFSTFLIVLSVRFPLMLILWVVFSITGDIHDFSVFVYDWIDENVPGFKKLKVAPKNVE